MHGYAIVALVNADLVMGPKLIAQGQKNNRADERKPLGALYFSFHNIFNVSGHSDLCLSICISIYNQHTCWIKSYF